MVELQCIINCKGRRRKRLWPTLRHYPEFSWRNTRKPVKTSARVVSTATETRLGPSRVQGWTVIAWAKLFGECLTAHRQVLTEMEETWPYWKNIKSLYWISSSLSPEKIPWSRQTKTQMERTPASSISRRKNLIAPKSYRFIIIIYLFWSHSSVTGSQNSTDSLTKHFLFITLPHTS